MVIKHLLDKTEGDMQSSGIFTYIDFTAAFDTISHPYLLDTLKRYGIPSKYCRLVKAIYEAAAVHVRLQERGGKRAYSRRISIRYPSLQGDILSPYFFLVALDRKESK